MEVRGPIEASLGSCQAWKRFQFPRMEVRGPIEASLGSCQAWKRSQFPRMEVRGPIEAGRTRVAIITARCFRGWKSAAPLKRGQAPECQPLSHRFPRMEVRGPIEATRAVWIMGRETSFPRMEVRGPIEAPRS